MYYQSALVVPFYFIDMHAIVSIEFLTRIKVSTPYFRTFCETVVDLRYIRVLCILDFINSYH